ncbi:MAG: hypothetical protein U1F23_01130 [Lysobacterales bacterium]
MLAQIAKYQLSRHGYLIDPGILGGATAPRSTTPSGNAAPVRIALRKIQRSLANIALVFGLRHP